MEKATLDGQKIEPHRVTKPIQLLAAWLVGLVLIDTLFVLSAVRFEATWEGATLVIAAVVNVPLFLAAIFVLQTRFRAELQDDPHYAVYLSKKTATIVSVEPDQGAFVKRVEVATAEGPSLISDDTAPIPAYSGVELDWSKWRVALNSHCPVFSKIRQALLDRRIPLAEIFGDAHKSGSSVPSRWVVAINRAMPLEHKLSILRIVSEFSFDGFQFWTPIREADETEDVYIGSYGTESFVRFTPELNEMLKGGVEDADLAYYVKRNRVRVLPKPR